MSNAGYQTAHQYALAQIRADILTGSLGAPGNRLVQGELAARLGLSTTPVREALRDLATEGLIQFDSHKGAVVREITLDEFTDLYELRVLLEPVAMTRAAARATPEELERADELCAAMEAAKDEAEWALLNREFHRTLQEAARYPVLVKLLEIVQDQSNLYVSFRKLVGRSRRAAGNPEHRAILRAVAAGDAGAAADAAREHLLETLALLDDQGARGSRPSGRKPASRRKATPNAKANSGGKAAANPARKATPNAKATARPKPAPARAARKR